MPRGKGRGSAPTGTGFGARFGNARANTKAENDRYCTEPITGGFKLVKASRGEFGQNDWPCITFEFECLVDGYEGKVWYHRIGYIANPEKPDYDPLSFLIGDLQKMGCTDEDFDTLEEGGGADYVAFDHLLTVLMNRKPSVTARLNWQKNNSDFLQMKIKRFIGNEEDSFEPGDDQPGNSERVDPGTSDLKDNSDPLPPDAFEVDYPIDTVVWFKVGGTGKERTGIVERIEGDEADPLFLVMPEGGKKQITLTHDEITGFETE